MDDDFIEWIDDRRYGARNGYLVQLVELFARGHGHLPMRALADRCRITHSTLIKHFGTREAVEGAVYARVLQNLQLLHFDADIGVDPKLEERVPKFLTRLKARMHRVPAEIALMSWIPAPDEYAEALKTHRRSLELQLEAVLRPRNAATLRRGEEAVLAPMLWAVLCAEIKRAFESADGRWLVWNLDIDRISALFTDYMLKNAPPEIVPVPAPSAYVSESELVKRDLGRFKNDLAATGPTEEPLKSVFAEDFAAEEPH